MTEPLEAWQALDPLVWASSDATVADGQLVLDLDVAIDDPGYVERLDPYDLTAEPLVVELTGLPEWDLGTTRVSAILHTGDELGPSLVFEWIGDRFHAGYRTTLGLPRVWLTNVYYSPAMHRYWRFRALDGFALFDVSPDGVDWTELGAWAATIPLDALTIRLEAVNDTLMPDGDPGAATFGPLNPVFDLELPDPLTVTADPGAPNVAIDVLPDNVPGTFLVGDPGLPGDGSLVDGDDLVSWGSGGLGWVNIVCDVTRWRVQRGATRRQGAMTRTEAGTIDLELIDTERRFDPTVNVDAIHPGIPIRVRLWGPGWSEVVGTGRIGGDNFRVQYLKTGAPVVTLTAVDVIGRLARYSGPGAEPPVGAGEDLLERVTRVLDEAGAPGDALSYDTDAAYAAALAATPLDRGWETITAASDAELGRVWVTRHDRLVVRGRGSELSGPVRLTLSDWHGEYVEGTPHCCYSDAVVGLGTELLATRAVAARRTFEVDDVSAVVTVDDPVAAARYTGGVPATVDERSLELATDVQLEPWARWVVEHGSTPELRVDSVIVAPWGAPEAWPALAALDVGDRAAFRLHPAVGPTVIRTLGVLGIVYDVTPDGWLIELTTIDAPTPTEGNPTGWFLVGDPGDPDDGSEVDSGDLLWPRGPVPEVVLP